MDPIKEIKKLRSKKEGKRFEFKLRINLWKILIAGLLVIFFLPFLLSAFQLQSTESKVDTSQLLIDIKEGKVKEVIVQDEKLVVTYEGGEIRTATKEGTESFAELLEKAKIDPTAVKYTVVDQTLTRAFGEILSVILPLALMALFFFFIIRAQTKGAQDIFSFVRSRARLFAKGKQNVTFNDVAGVNDA